ncbi:MAG: PrsW family intramembrane metalloprotease [Salinivirgaceae bacterium]|nr:PrsW family intramembrane metalloprotease [Salinivirgaceae bacterium]
MINLLIVSTAPILIILAYIYYRDKYEKEPLSLLFEGLVAGGVIVLPIIYFERIIESWGSNLSPLGQAAWTAFLVAALVEEGLKFFAVYLLIWKNSNFNEKFDGIVYAVFVSLGFALVENISYVFKFDNGMQVGVMRAFTAVPAHAIFGIIMGYRLGLAKFIPSKRLKNLVLAFLIPFLFHGVYDFILMVNKDFLLIFFFGFVIFMYWYSKKRMAQMVDATVFNPDLINEE